MKKSVYILIAALIFSLILSSCSASGDDKEATTNNTNDTEKTASNSISVDEKVLIERDGIRVTLKSIEKSYSATELKILIENDSETDITVRPYDSTINGIMVDNMYSVQVGSGKKANDSITFMNSALKAAGIEGIKDISFKLNVYVSEDWETIFDTEQIEIAVNGNADYVQTFDDVGVEILNRDGFRIVAKDISYDESSAWGSELSLYIENTSGEDITIYAENVSVNGFMVSPMFYCDVLSGMKAYAQISFWKTELDENGITEIENIELSFDIRYKVGWETILLTNPIIIYF